MEPGRSQGALGRFAGKLAALIAVLFLVTVASFALVNLLPGDPSTAVVPPGASPEVTRQVRAEFGLDDNVAVRYARWVGRVAHGDLGTSSRNGEPVSAVLRRGLTVTVVLHREGVGERRCRTDRRHIPQDPAE